MKNRWRIWKLRIKEIKVTQKKVMKNVDRDHKGEETKNRNKTYDEEEKK